MSTLAGLLNSLADRRNEEAKELGCNDNLRCGAERLMVVTVGIMSNKFLTDPPRIY